MRLAFSESDVDQTFQLSFSSLLRRYYQIQRTADLPQGRWTGFANALFGQGADLPLGGPIRTNDPVMYYRVLHVN